MKAWYLSKTLWINVIAFIALAVQSRIGFVVDAEMQAGLLTVVNLVLRIVTRDGINWGAPASPPDGPAAYQGGFLRLSLLPVLLLIGLLFLLAGCAGKSPQETAALSLLTTQKAVVSAAEITDALCRSGKLDPPKCDRARDAYGKAGKSYDLAADALITAVKAGDPGALERYALAERQFSVLAGDFLALAVEFNAIPAPGGAK